MYSASRLNASSTAAGTVPDPPHVGGEAVWPLTGHRSNDRRMLAFIRVHWFLGDRLGGHIVTGHVDAVGHVKQMTASQNAIIIEIEVPPACSRYLVEKGSIAVDGISLTINSVRSNSFQLSIIPHTLDVTTLKELRTGSKVNIETDILGKYVERLMPNKPANESSLTSEILAKHGFL